MQENNNTIHVWILSDEKPGHVSQLEGLEKRLTHHDNVKTVWLPPQVRKINQLTKRTTTPHMIIGAGHGTHKALLWFAHTFKTFSVVLMKPSIPARFFDAVICPKHDQLKERGNVLQTLGAINKISPNSKRTRTENLILLGGPSKHFEWQDELIIDQIREICSYHANQQWKVFNSRRTPHTLVKKLGNLSKTNMTLCIDAQNLEENLAIADKVWVSPDSVSMVYEALTAQAKVALLKLEPKRTQSKIQRGIAELIRDDYLVDYDEWISNHHYHSANTIWEADRAAQWLLRKYREKNRHDI